MATAKNPSTLIFWNDLENDEQLKTCSLAAKGLWDHHMLPIAARSPESGVVILGNHPSKLDDDLPLLLARAAGESRDVVVGLLAELVESGAASVDEQGRVYNRRMVREEGIRRVRSEAGRRGAETTNTRNLDRRQKSGKHPGNVAGAGVSKPHGKPAGKMNGRGEWLRDDETTTICQHDDLAERQNHGKPSGKPVGNPAGKTAPSSLLHASDFNVTTTRTEVTNGTGAPEEGEAVKVWNEVAARVGWPKVQRITPARRKALRARLAECGGIDGWRIAVEKAAASSFLTGKTRRSEAHANWRCGLDFILRQNPFTKLMEGGFDDPPGSTDQASADGGAPTVADGIAAAFARRSLSSGG